jgi:hypothetical protein
MVPSSNLFTGFPFEQLASIGSGTVETTNQMGSFYRIWMAAVTNNHGLFGVFIAFTAMSVGEPLAIPAYFFFL